jgi:hypothetical protein
VHPGQHLVGVEVSAWFYVFRVIEQRSVKMRFVGKALRSIEHRRAAFAAEASRIPRAAFITNRQIPEELPATILLPDPCRERRGGGSTAAFTMTVSDPIRTCSELEDAGTTEASPADDTLRPVAHARQSSAATDGAEAFHPVRRLPGRRRACRLMADQLRPEHFELMPLAQLSILMRSYD